ncbi:MAG: hypothetical protein JSR18_08490 [Proteobacteria bacterium]|nr:hypothetical protein [Pseudomonadota bacterium]
MASGDRAVAVVEAGGDAHGVCWRSILAGAAVAAAMSLILLSLGLGLGLSSISPWSYQGVSADTITLVAVVWLVVMAAIAAGLGGYVAGRLRPEWRGVHADETHFRDTAHGFVAWAVATLLTAAALTGAASSMVGVATVAGGGIAAAAAAAQNPALADDAQRGPDAAAPLTDYYGDMLFRSDKPADAGADTFAQRRETARVVGHALRAGQLPPGDRTYLAQQVALRTGISQQDAEARVDQTFNAARTALDDAKTKAKQAADKARHATAWLALWVFLSLLVGAFSASFMAMVGGRQRGSLGQRAFR